MALSSSGRWSPRNSWSAPPASSRRSLTAVGLGKTRLLPDKPEFAPEQRRIEVVVGPSDPMRRPAVGSPQPATPAAGLPLPVLPWHELRGSALPARRAALEAYGDRPGSGPAAGADRARCAERARPALRAGLSAAAPGGRGEPVHTTRTETCRPMAAARLQEDPARRPGPARRRARPARSDDPGGGAGGDGRPRRSRGRT